jgi:hypothetical protein
MNNDFTPSPRFTHPCDSQADADTADESPSILPEPPALRGSDTALHDVQGDPAMDNIRSFETEERILSPGSEPITNSQNGAPDRQDGPTPAGEFNYATHTHHADAQELANVCQRYLELIDSGEHSLRTAAAALGKSPSFFSGNNSMLARYQREGVAGLMQRRGETGAPAQFAVPDWFIPAANFFYLITNRTWNRGSVPEAVLRTISLPALPIGWTNAIKTRFLRSIGMKDVPVCAIELREQILARQKLGKQLVPERIARQIAVNQATVRQHRNKKEAALDFLSAPGGMRLFGPERRLARAGEIIEADDGTINFPVCIPWNRGGDPCSDRYGVRVGRFQWLPSICAGTSFIPAYSYTARPRSSYRGEDVVSLIRMFVRQHGVPKKFRFERGVWESKLVKECIRMLGCELDTVYSPHQKPFIEGLFNALWTKLSVHFPGAHVGRFRGEEKEACDLLTACQRGHKDPRKYFPMLALAIAVFDEVIAEKNRTPVKSAHHGMWVPEERWANELPQSRLARLDAASEWMFSPFVREWTVKGMLVGGKVPMFEDMSVPFDFSAPWLVQYDRARVRCFFDPADPRCQATLVLAERFNGLDAGKVIGTAQQVNDLAGYVRLVMGLGEDPAGLAIKLRQQTAAALRREVRAVMPRGQRAQSASEERDGLGSVAKMECDAATEAKAATPAPVRKAESTVGRSSRLATQAAIANRLRDLEVK